MIAKQMKSLAAGVALLALGSGIAWAAGYFTNGLPVAGGSQYPTTLPLTGNETIPADTNLAQGLNPASEAITTNQLAGWSAGQPTAGNVLIGGDAETNLFAYLSGSSATSVTTTATYGGPNRFIYWSGASTAMTVTKDTTTADLPPAFGAGFKMQRTSGQTGVAPLCMMQEIETVNALQLQSNTVEVDFHAMPNAGFSAASPYNMQVVLLTGTGTDEGTSKAAFSINSGGGGASQWTGATSASVLIPMTNLSPSTVGRYAAYFNVPATATEAAVALCYTPVGTAGSGGNQDFVTFAGIQLKRSPYYAGFAGTGGVTVASAGGTPGTAVTVNIPSSAFERRSQALENVLQERYHEKWTEAQNTGGLSTGMTWPVTTEETWVIPTRVLMRTTPSITVQQGNFSTTSNTTPTALTSLSPSVSPSTPYAVTIIGQTAASLGPSEPVILFGQNGQGHIEADSEL